MTEQRSGIHELAGVILWSQCTGEMPPPRALVARDSQTFPFADSLPGSNTFGVVDRRIMDRAQQTNQFV
jgi:hypothetical protein